MDPETAARIEGEVAPNDDAFEVWQENEEAVKLFLKLATQWKVTGFGGVTGLDYVAVKATMDIIGTKNREAILEGLQVMELAALRIWSKKGDA